MATTMMAGQVAARGLAGSSLSSGPCSTSGRTAGASSAFFGRTQLACPPARDSTSRLRCEAPGPVQERESVKERMQRAVDAHDERERHSRGLIPMEGKFPRPERERRPEFGNTGFGNIMAFDGPGPETINGRLAMLGFLYAFMTERATGLSVAQQVGLGPGLYQFLLLGQVFTWASLIPMANGFSPDSLRSGPGGMWNGKAERWNGRAAMLGFVALLITEAVIGHALFAGPPILFGISI